MSPHPPFRLTAREVSKGGSVKPAHVVGSYDPRGFKLLTIFVHGYNNGEFRALKRWDNEIWPTLSSLTDTLIDGVVLFFWPGDSSSRMKALSAASYPARIPVAIEAGVQLGKYVRQISKLNPGLQVQFVGHSLGCRVVLSAAEQLAESPRTVPVVRTLLMGAAVPEGDCIAPGPWSNGVRSSFKGTSDRIFSDVGDVVLYSDNDDILRRVFPAGERAAEVFGIKSHPPRSAVGLTGGPNGRWDGTNESCGLKHDEYPRHKRALSHVAQMFGPLVNRPLTERPSGEFLGEGRHLDKRDLAAVPSFD